VAISEAQLETWSRQGSITQSKATYDTISAVLKDPKAPYASKNFDVFLQGSYGNDTNIYADSDVDVVIRLSSTYYYDTSSLSPEDEVVFHRETSAGTYSFNEFKVDVLWWLTQCFGNGVKAGKKAISIPGNGSRRDADVLVCVEHRSYYNYKGNYSNNYHEGVCFWTSDSTKIVNYPKQHMANCTTKHQSTSNLFKPTIRTLKNMRNAMIENGYLLDGVAPSYFLEGMLHNVPITLFVPSRATTFTNYMVWLDECDHSKLLCANGRYFLLYENSPVCWRKKDFDTFRAAAASFWRES
jgi:hypothetical protein